MTGPLLIEAAGLGLVGLCLGSFVSTAALRMVRDEPFLAGRSHCDVCDSQLSYFDSLPVISFLVRRGACADCGAPIDRTHLAGEIYGLLLLVAAFAIAPPVRALLVSLMGLCLLASAIVDSKTLRLPDSLTLAAAALALSAVRSVTALELGLATAAVTVVVLESLRRGYKAYRGVSGLGFGDVKLAGALALWLGPAMPWAIATAAVLGLAIAFLRRSGPEQFAFGPALVGGGLIVGLVEEALRWPAWA